MAEIHAADLAALDRGADGDPGLKPVANSETSILLSRAEIACRWAIRPERRWHPATRAGRRALGKWDPSRTRDRGAAMEIVSTAVYVGPNVYSKHR